MSQFRFSLVLGLAALFLTPGYGAIKRLDDRKAFSSASVTIDFEGQLDGADAGNLFGSWHLAFKAPQPDVVRIRTEFLLFSNYFCASPKMQRCQDTQPENYERRSGPGSARCSSRTDRKSQRVRLLPSLGGGNSQPA